MDMALVFAVFMRIPLHLHHLAKQSKATFKFIQ